MSTPPPRPVLHLRRSIVRRIVWQATLITTFVIVVLSTVAYMLASAALTDPAVGLTMLARSLTLVGALLVGFAAATGFLLARQVTDPLRRLATKVSELRPGSWQAEQTVRTGDEVEVLDVALVATAGRLAAVYAHQEEEIAARTEDLRKQYALERAILGSIHFGVITLDPSGVLTHANPAAETLLQGAALLGRNIEEVFPLREGRGKRIEGEHPIRACLVNGAVYRSSASSHLSVECNDGSLLPIALSVVPLKESDRTFGALVVFQNVAQERRLDYLKSEFITLASHQLRTPLSAIRWYAELLGDSRAGFTEEQASYVNEIDHSVRRMIALLGALLHAARLEDDDLKPSMQETNLTTLVGDALRDMEETFEGSAIRHTLDVPPDALPVVTDPVLLKVVLQNLIGNAVKYSPKNSTVVIRVERRDDRALLSVADEGMGIPAADQERIFEKFFRAANVRQVDTDGNGLGLAISKSIVDRLGGEMTFVSTEGKGSTFTVSLPVKKA